MTATPRYLVQLSSAEIAFLHALVQRQLRRFVAECPEGRGVGPAVAPPELVALDRRLLARWKEIAEHEEAYFGVQARRRPEAARIAEEYAALAGAAKGTWGAQASTLPPSGRQAGNVIPLRGASR